MEYEEAMRRYEESMRHYEAQRENESFEMAVAIADAMKMEGVKRLKKAAKALPGSSAPEEYDQACKTLAEWAGQSIKEADRQIRDAAGRIDKTLKYADTRPRDEKGRLINVCEPCIMELDGNARACVSFLGWQKWFWARKEKIMANFDEDIKRITNELMEDGTVDKIIREKVCKGFEDAIDSAFRWGELKDAIEKRVKEVMVPCIERYDMGDYIVKLDTVLTDIVNHTGILDNKKILKNFQTLMIEPEEKEVTLGQIFKMYKKHVSKYMDTTGRDIVFDCDRPYYEAMGVTAGIDEEEDEPWRHFRYAVLELAVDEEEQQEKLNFSIRLSRWKEDKEKGYEIGYDVPQSVNGLRRLSDFEVYLLSLSRAGVRLLDDEKEDFDEVTAEKMPEPTYE